MNQICVRFLLNVNMIVRIIVQKKMGVLDVEGKTIHKALNDLGYVDVLDVKRSTAIDIEVAESITKDPQKLKSLIEGMCQDLLVNEVIESFSYQVL